MSIFNAFGFVPGNVERFRRALLDHPVGNEVHEARSGPYGTKFVVRCTIDTPDGRNPCIQTIWIDDGDGMPRLVSAYPFD